MNFKLDQNLIHYKIDYRFDHQIEDCRIAEMQISKYFDKLKNKIDELKQMQKFPRFHLSKYFDELKNEIDIKYAVKQDEQVKYLEMIKNIELFEQDAYKKCKSFNNYDEEIKLIEDKSNDSNLNEIKQLIDELKYKIEKKIFSNKSIFFYEKDKKYSFLIIINDKYIRKKCIDYGAFGILTREELNVLILNGIIERTTNKDSINVLNININKEDIKYRNRYIREIHENTFNGLSNLKKIEFSFNLIKAIHPKLFNGLANLEIIYFICNQIEVIHENTFNGLSNLKQIYLYSNQIKAIHPNLFNGLANLEMIFFMNNQIDAIHENTFNGLTNLNK
jgi:hypothetical protein